MNTDLSLRDIHLPEAIHPFWPPAPGFWILGILCLTILIWLIFWCVKKWQKKRPARVALKQLKHLESTQSDHPHLFAAELSVILKKVALAYYPRTEVAQLSEEDWLVFLNQTGKTKAFTAKEGQLLKSLPYNHKQTGDVYELSKLAKRWIRKVA